MTVVELIQEFGTEERCLEYLENGDYVEKVLEGCLTKLNGQL